VVDSALAERYREASEKDQARLAKAVETDFPEFHPTIGEEELTTKTYRFPRSKLIITASVFYTDESLRSVKSADSIIVAVVVSSRRSEKRYPLKITRSQRRPIQRTQSLSKPESSCE
jgi:hypothetical protein